MFRATALAIAFLSSGCYPNADVKKDGKEKSKRAAPLTEDEKIGWQKYRKDIPGRYIIIAYRHQKAEWEELFRYSDDGGLKDAQDALPNIASSASTKMAAVLDLSSKEKPFALRWASDVGKGPRTHDSIPFPELKDSFDDFIVEYQRKASR